jgi:hypothetical protein
MPIVVQVVHHDILFMKTFFLMMLYIYIKTRSQNWKTTLKILYTHTDRSIFMRKFPLIYYNIIYNII